MHRDTVRAMPCLYDIASEVNERFVVHPDFAYTGGVSKQTFHSGNVIFPAEKSAVPGVSYGKNRKRYMRTVKTAA